VLSGRVTEQVYRLHTEGEALTQAILRFQRYGSPDGGVLHARFGLEFHGRDWQTDVAAKSVNDDLVCTPAGRGQAYEQALPGELDIAFIHH
jgi:hypothetical protein